MLSDLVWVSIDGNHLQDKSKYSGIIQEMSHISALGLFPKEYFLPYCFTAVTTIRVANGHRHVEQVRTTSHRDIIVQMVWTVLFRSFHNNAMTHLP